MELHGSDLLRHVSRSFFLTLRVLPGAIRPQISVAYLLARATDTIADTRLISLELRRQALREMRRAICDTAETGRAEPPDFGELASAQESTPGARVTGRTDAAGNISQSCSSNWAHSDPRTEQRIRDLLETITRGQESIWTGSASARHRGDGIARPGCRPRAGGIHLLRRRLCRRILDEDVPRPLVPRHGTR